MDSSTRLDNSHPNDFDTTYTPDDAGNAERLLARYGHNMRYVPARGKWLVWKDGRWEWDADGQVVRWAIATIDYAQTNEPALAPDAEEGKKVLKHLLRSRNKPPLDRMVSLAQDQGGSVALEDLDADPWLVGVENGTIDLRTGQLREARREDLITKVLDVEYDPEAEAPAFAKFLEDVQPNAEDREYLQRCAGYTLVGSTRDQVMLILYGTGANGKTTFLEALAHVLGPLASHTSSQTLTGAGNYQHPEALARLSGARMVVSMESERNSRLREGVVKAITGGEPVTARFLYGDSFEYEPRYTVWMAVNELPTVTGSDRGIWRRLMPVPFDVTIGEKDRDPDLPDKLRDEAAGILAWMVQGARRWQARRLSDYPASVVNEKAEYRNSMDHVKRFIDDCFEREPDAFTTNSTIYRVARIWFEDEGLKLPSKIKLGRKLKAHGLAKGHKNIGRGRNGIRLDPEWDERLSEEDLAL